MASGRCNEEDAMALRGEERKRELVESVAAMAAAQRTADRTDALARAIRQFYAHVPPDDLVSRDPGELYAAAVSLWEFAQQRQPGKTKLRVLDPRAGDRGTGDKGARGTRTVIEIVNDDMPFLVDSVTAALNGLDLVVHLVIHPIFRLRRDVAGQVVELLEPDAGGANGSDGGFALRESLMHVEIAEQPDAQR